jgi:hypothetical protein
MGQDLISTISRISGGLKSGRYTSEAAVREALVLPLLRGLGWDDLDPDRVVREFRVGGRRVDYGLCAFGGKPSVFLEVKAPELITGDRQLFEYAFHEGVPMAILTNGREWNFYLPGAQGSYDDRLLYKLDLVERQASEVAERLHRYLEFERVRSGSAQEDALRDYKDLHNQRIVKDAIPRAWNQLIAEPDELLVELIADRAASICGFRPELELIQQFLSRLSHSPAPLPPDGLPKPEPGPHPPPPDGPHVYEFLGRRLSARSAIDVVIAVLREMANKDSRFFEKFESVARGRSRNHVARRIEDVYPGHPQLAKYVLEVVPGWYFGTNIANREKKRLLEAACKVAGLRFGTDLRVDFPHAADP